MMHLETAENTNRISLESADFGVARPKARWRSLTTVTWARGLWSAAIWAAMFSNGPEIDPVPLSAPRLAFPAAFHCSPYPWHFIWH